MTSEILHRKIDNILQMEQKWRDSDETEKPKVSMFLELRILSEIEYFWIRSHTLQY